MDWNLGTAVRTLCQETRGEPIEGQTAVAWVLRNRLESGRWGASLASVCLWHAQFSGWWCPRGAPSYHDPNFAYACALRDDDPIIMHMLEVLQGALDGDTDPTDGATHYHANSIPAPAWTVGAIFCGRYGNQLFFKGVK